MTVRHPVDIYMKDRGSDARCVTLQVLYMFGREKRPLNLPNIDQQIERQPGESISLKAYILELLQQGLTLTAIESFDVQIMFGPNGYDYTRQFLLERHPVQFLAFTPDQFAVMQAAAFDFWQQVEQLPGTFNKPFKTRLLRTFSYLLNTGYDAVIVPSPLEGIKTKLAYATNASGAIAFYVPQFSHLHEPLTQEIAGHAIDPWLGPYDSIIGVSS